MNGRHFVPWAVAVVAALVLAAPAQAALIDFEGVAPAGNQTTDDGTNRVFDGFNVFVPHGHYQSDGFLAPPRPVNGTDWLLHDHFGTSADQPVVVTQVGGGAFDLFSIDASEWENTFPLGQTLTLTGHFQGGGTIVANFLTDNLFGFQTFAVGGFTNLVQLDIIGSSAAGFGSCTGFEVCGSLGYDNVVVAPVPEPASVVLLGLGLGAMGLRRRARR